MPCEFVDLVSGNPAGEPCCRYCGRVQSSPEQECAGQRPVAKARVLRRLPIAEARREAANRELERSRLLGLDADADYFACIHRGPVLRQVKCGLCGNRTEMVDIHGCAIHKECTLRRFKTAQRTQDCLTCRDRIVVSG